MSVNTNLYPFNKKLKYCCKDMHNFMLNETISNQILEKLEESLSKGSQPNLSYCIWCNDKLSKNVEKKFEIKILDKCKINLANEFNFQQYCCKDMKLFLLDFEDPIKYDLVFREYYIELYNQLNIITLTYCPWCGTKLPKELRSEFFDILQNEYNVNVNIGDYKKSPFIPTEFKTDEWWKKRGL